MNFDTINQLFKYSSQQQGSTKDVSVNMAVYQSCFQKRVSNDGNYSFWNKYNNLSNAIYIYTFSQSYMVRDVVVHDQSSTHRNS